MRRALGLVLVLAVVIATPALAQVTTNPSEVTAPAFETDHGHGEEASPHGDGDEGRDGTDPVTFAALLIAGLALMAAVAALIFARVREPA